jgi:hypothetical protein
MEPETLDDPGQTIPDGDLPHIACSWLATPLDYVIMKPVGK